MCCAYLQVTSEFLIVNDDVLGLVALEVHLLQAVFQGAHFLWSQTSEHPNQWQCCILYNIEAHLWIIRTTIASSSFFRVRASQCFALAPAAFFTLWYSSWSSSRRRCWVRVACFRASSRFLLLSTFSWSASPAALEGEGKWVITFCHNVETLNFFLMFIKICCLFSHLPWHVAEGLSLWASAAKGHSDDDFITLGEAEHHKK